MNDFIIVMISYLGVFIIALGVVSFLLRGFFLSYLKVKGSRGRLVLVKIRSLIGNYYRSGTVEEGDVIYKDRNKNTKRITIPKKTTGIYRELGVVMVDVSEELNCIIDINFSAVSGFDADRMNSLYLRALYRPTILDEKQKIILILLGVCIVLSIIGLAMNYSTGKNIKALSASINYMQQFFITNNATTPIL